MQDYIALTNQYNQILTQNQTATNQDLEDALHNMEEMYAQLMEDFEVTITSLEQTINEKDAYVMELQGETGALIEENQNIIAEMEALEDEFTQYRATHDISEDEYTLIQSSLNSALTARNLLGLTTLLFIRATVAVYLKFRKENQ